MGTNQNATDTEASFQYDVFLSHSSKDKPAVRVVAARLKKDGVRVWLDEEQIRAGDSIPAKIEEGLERSRVLVLCMSANAFGSDWAQLEAGTFRFRDPLNKERRLVPLRLDDTPIKGSLAQFLYINWLPPHRDQEYKKLLGASRSPAKSATISAQTAEKSPQSQAELNLQSLTATDDYVRRRRDTIEQVFAAFEVIHAFFFKVCVDYLSFVEILQAGVTASDADRTRYYNYIEEIGHKLHEIHINEGRLRVAGAEPAVLLMQQYRLQATEVNDMLRLQQPTLRKSQVNSVTEELFRRKDRLYEELARALRLDGSEGVITMSAGGTRAAASPIGEVRSGLRGVTAICPDSQHIGDLKSNSTPATQVRQEKIATAAKAIHTAFLRIVDSYEDCVLLVEDNNVAKLRDRQAQFRKYEQAFWLAFQANNIYLPADAMNDIRAIVTDCIRCVRMSARVQTLIDSKPTEEGQKVVESQNLEIEKLEDKILSLRPKVEAHFRRLIIDHA